MAAMGQAPAPAGVVFMMVSPWAPSQGFGWGYGGQTYSIQSDQNSMQAPGAMQQSAAQANQPDVVGKGAKVKRQMSAPTTIFFRNVPNNCSAKKILELLDTNGFNSTYDFVYVPHDFKRLPSLVTLGFFFVNFVSHDAAAKALEKFVGFSDWSRWGMDSTKVLDAAWATQTQGKKSCIKRYRNCPVMHETVPAECKPMVFENGVMMPFEAPKKNVKQPRFKKGYLPEGQPRDDDSTDAPQEECSSEELSWKEDSTDEMVPASSSTVWIPDESACSCSKCEEAFTMFRRRHHCRGCGEICCAQCAPRTSSRLPTFLKRGEAPSFKRLCKDCAQGLAVSAPGPATPACLVRNTFIDVKDPMFLSRISVDCSDSFPY